MKWPVFLRVCLFKNKNFYSLIHFSWWRGFLTALKFRSSTTRTLLSMLVRFFLRLPGRPSRPSMGLDSEEGLGSMLSTAMVSVTHRGPRSTWRHTAPKPRRMVKILRCRFKQKIHFKSLFIHVIKNVQLLLMWSKSKKFSGVFCVFQRFPD